MKKKPLRLREPEQERRLDRPLRLRDDEQTLKVRLKPFRDLCSLTSDEEIDLIYRARAGDARAKERVVAAHIGFLMRKAKRYARLKVLPIDDLFQEGCVGFQRAVERFNPDRGARLATYASKIVDGAMLDALDKKAVMRTVPHHIRRMLNRYRETFRALTQRLGREPTRDDLAKEMKIKQQTVEVLEALSQPVTSLSVSVGRDFGETTEAEVELIDCIPDEYPDSALEEAMKKRERELLHSLLSTLPERHPVRAENALRARSRRRRRTNAAGDCRHCRDQQTGDS